MFARENLTSHRLEKEKKIAEEKFQEAKEVENIRT